MLRTAYMMLLVAAPLMLSPLARASEPPPPPPDPELLEFLGSADDDPDLQQYVAPEAPQPAGVKPKPNNGDGRT